MGKMQTTKNCTAPAGSICQWQCAGCKYNADREKQKYVPSGSLDGCIADKSHEAAPSRS